MDAESIQIPNSPETPIRTERRGAPLLGSASQHIYKVADVRVIWKRFPRKLSGLNYLLKEGLKIGPGVGPIRAQNPISASLDFRRSGSCRYRGLQDRSFRSLNGESVPHSALVRLAPSSVASIRTPSAKNRVVTGLNPLADF